VAYPGKWRSERPRDGHVFVTDGGHWIVDAHLGRIEDTPRLAGLLGAIPGVVEHGCSSVSPARPFWRVRKEFALLSGSDAAAFQGETE
jgi:ribose 5-phosphate isomerase